MILQLSSTNILKTLKISHENKEFFLLKSSNNYTIFLNREKKDYYGLSANDKELLEEMLFKNILQQNNITIDKISDDQNLNQFDSSKIWNSFYELKLNESVSLGEGLLFGKNFEENHYLIDVKKFLNENRFFKDRISLLDLIFYMFTKSLIRSSNIRNLSYPVSLKDVIISENNEQYREITSKEIAIYYII